jgi:hypothetical protein
MYPYYSRSRERDFNEREVLTMLLMAQRRGGNVWPDNDRTATSSATEVLVFVN